MTRRELCGVKDHPQLVLIICALFAGAALRAFAVEKGREKNAVLAMGCGDKRKTACFALPMKFLQFVDVETEFRRTGRLLVRGRMQGERDIAGRELAPARRLELERQTERIAIEADG